MTKDLRSQILNGSQSSQVAIETKSSKNKSMASLWLRYSVHYTVLLYNKRVSYKDYV